MNKTKQSCRQKNTMKKNIQKMEGFKVLRNEWLNFSKKKLESWNDINGKK